MTRETQNISEQYVCSCSKDFQAQKWYFKPKTNIQIQLTKKIGNWQQDPHCNQGWILWVLVHCINPIVFE